MFYGSKTVTKNRKKDKEMQKISLNGNWELCLQDVGKGKIEEVKTLFGGEVYSCPVPGDIHMALTEAGVIKDPLIDENSKECRWLEEKEFWYRKTFDVPEDFLQDETEIVFEGLDLTADIWLNGQYIGSHNNAFIEKVIPVSSVIRQGENELVVRIDDGVHGVKDKDVDFNKLSWNNEQPYRAWMRKPQFVYGWDWTIWLPTCGIWKSVYLNSYHKAAIRNVNIRDCYEGAVISGADKITLAMDVETETFGPGNYVLKCEIRGDKRFETCAQEGTKEPDLLVVAEGRVELALVERASVCKTIEFLIDNPKLWWPNGAGNPYLYSVCVVLEDENGKELERKCVRHGIRSVRIDEPALDEKAKSFTYVINDTPIFAKGANHVPADCLIGRITDEKNRKLLTEAAKAHMNMIRVWGGGIYESEGFMDACDELGLMVWHDFMFACQYYPDHVPEFYEEIRREATAAIKRLRLHSCLVGWSGNNEIQEMYTSAKNGGNDIPWYGGRLYEELLPGLVKELCPDRIYRESSPFGGEEPTSYDMGDQHTWHFTHRPAWEHYLDLWRFTDFDFKFLSEFGIIGAMNLESAKKCIKEDALNPHSPEWLHHTNTSVEHQLVDIFVKKYFDVDDSISLQEYILKSQVLQGELMRHVYDELRSRKFRCSGILLWTLSDSYGIHNWSVIDYYLGKRPVYYYLKRSMAPVNVSFMGYEVQTFDGMAGYKEYYKGDVKPVEVLLTSDMLADKNVTLEYQVLTFDGRELMSGQQNLILAANSVKRGIYVDISEIVARKNGTDEMSFVPEETFLYARVFADGEVLNENKYLFAPYGKLNLKKADVAYEVEVVSESEAQLTLKADTFVWMLHLSDAEGFEYSDNDFDLLPGMPKVVHVTGNGVKEFEPKLCALNSLTY